MLNILYSYFGQTEMVKKQVKEWKKYSDQVNLCYVDDCAQVPLVKPEGTEAYRITTDIKCNQGGARNLGMSKLKGWVVMLDMDYLLTRQNIQRIFSEKLEKGTVYYLTRTGEPLSYTIYLIHTDDFKDIGGYDEDFSGHYGWEDSEFNHRVKERKNRDVLDIKVKYFPGESSGGSDIQRNRDLLDWKLMMRDKGKNLRFKWKKL
jgi:hypothetical protein